MTKETTQKKQGMSKGKKAATWAGVLAVLIPLLITIISSLDGKAIGDNLNSKLSGQAIVVTQEEPKKDESPRRPSEALLRPEDLDPIQASPGILERLPAPIEGLLERVLELEEWVKTHGGTSAANQQEIQAIKQTLSELKTQIDAIEKIVDIYTEARRKDGEKIDKIYDSLNEIRERTARIEGKLEGYGR